jgi:cell division ATPase FtsA
MFSDLFGLKDMAADLALSLSLAERVGRRVGDGTTARHDDENVADVSNVRNRPQRMVHHDLLLKRENAL